MPGRRLRRDALQTRDRRGLRCIGRKHCLGGPGPAVQHDARGLSSRREYRVGARVTVHRIRDTVQSFVSRYCESSAGDTALGSETLRARKLRCPPSVRKQGHVAAPATAAPFKNLRRSAENLRDLAINQCLPSAHSDDRAEGIL